MCGALCPMCQNLAERSGHRSIPVRSRAHGVQICTAVTPLKERSSRVVLRELQRWAGRCARCTGTCGWRGSCRRWMRRTTCARPSGGPSARASSSAPPTAPGPSLTSASTRCPPCFSFSPSWPVAIKIRPSLTSGSTRCPPYVFFFSLSGSEVIEMPFQCI